MFNRVFQTVIHQMKESVNRVIGITDKNDIIVACSDLQHIGEVRQGIYEAISVKPDGIESNGYSYRCMMINEKPDLIVFVEGTDQLASQTASILAITLGNMKCLYDQKYDKVSFIKNVMLENILPSDIYTKAKDLHFVTDQIRLVYIIKFTGKGEHLAIELVGDQFKDKSKDYVLSTSEQDIVLVREFSEIPYDEDNEQVANMLIDLLTNDGYQNVSIGYSSLISNIKDLAKAYKEARIALEVGKVFDTYKNPICYENLGIGRLIYQLPQTLCDLFLSEVFRRGSLESLDQETLDTVRAFFENNLNVSETSRKLFIHRNTLVYRLEKIRKLTGLDLREFESAVTFKVALMVKKYLTNKPIKF